MTSATSQLRQIAQSDGLPMTAITRGGVTFYPREDVWKYRDGLNDVSLIWRKLGAYPLDLLDGIKATMVWYAKHGSPASLHAYFAAFQYWAEVNTAPVFTEREFYRFRAIHASTRVVGHVKAFLRKWHRLGVPGVSRDLMKVLSSTKEKSGPKGVSVATMDPHDGPFTDIELQGLHGALSDAFGAARLSGRDHALVWLCTATGARPVQLASLKVKDVHRRSVEGQFHYDIDVPRGKQRGKLRRAEVKNRPLMVQIGAAVYAYAQGVKEQFLPLLPDAEEAPLFPQFEKRKGQWTPGFEYHPTATRIAGMVRACLDELQVISERTGKPMNTSPIRFRRTLGTRAAQEGHGALVIAELLDHSDTQSVGVYVESRPEMAERIDKAVALELAPLAQAFKGKLVRTTSEATRGGDPSARIRDLRFGDKDEGFCGSHGFCGFNAPIACYTCHSFEPWLDGPHEAVLESLLAKRDRQLANGDKRIAAINDRTILAVAQVVQLCELQLRGIRSE
jgi:integrase